MSLISFTPLQDGVTGVNASATNTPLSTIYNDYNGNITNANIAANAAIAGSKVSPATLPISSLVTSYVNSGSAGGTFYYMNLGGVKMLWGSSGTVAAGAVGQTSVVVTFPSGFFSSIQSAVASPNGNAAGTNDVYIGVNAVAANTTNWSVELVVTSGTSTGMSFSVFVIGT